MYDEFIGFTNVHAEFMVEKSKRSGELELVHFWWAENPVIADSFDMDSEKPGDISSYLQNFIAPRPDSAITGLRRPCSLLSQWKCRNEA